MKIALIASLFLASVPALGAERYSVIFGGKTVGHLWADSAGGTTKIDFDYKNNGRGPTMIETVTVGADGLPTAWSVDGATTFGSKVAERFAKRSEERRVGKEC